MKEQNDGKRSISYRDEQGKSQTMTVDRVRGTHPDAFNPLSYRYHEKPGAMDWREG